MTLPKISVSLKLYSLVVVTSCIILAIGMYGTQQLRSMEGNTKIIYYDELLSMDYLTTMRSCYYGGIVQSIHEYEERAISRDTLMTRLLDDRSRIDSNWLAYKATYLTAPESALIRTNEPKIAAIDSLISRLAAGAAENAETPQLQKLKGTIATLTPDLSSLIKLQVSVSEEFYQKNKTLYQTTSRHFKELVVCGLLFAFVLSIFIIRDTQRLIRWLSTSREKISESEEKYRYLFNHSPAYVIIWDPVTLLVLEVNQLALEHYGYTRDEWQGMSVLDYRPVSDWEDIRSFAADLVDGSTTFRRKTWQHIFKNGELHYMNISSHLIQYRDQKAVLSMGEDVTDKYQTEETLRKMNEQIKGLYAHLQSAREDERKYLAREIHDELGQYLTILKMEISSVDKKIAPSDPAIREKLDGIYAQIDLTVRTVRRIISHLRPPVLDDIGVAAAIEWDLAELKKRSGINFTFASDMVEQYISPDIAIAVYRIYQEAMTNILRHAGAATIHVSIDLYGGQLRLHIIDDGRGFDTGAIGSGTTYGIIGMKERAAAVGGEVTIYSQPGQGCTVILQVNLKDEDTITNPKNQTI